MLKILGSLPLLDWIALGWFFFCWVFFVWFAKRRAHSGGKTLLAATNAYRQLWMQQASLRDQRTLDAIITQNLSTAPAFFASTTIIIIGGVAAMFGSTEEVAEIFSEVPFVKQTSLFLYEVKIFLLLSIFIFAFFRFSWAIRQYTFAAIVIGAMPDDSAFKAGRYAHKDYAQRAAILLSMAAETFNAGIRAYYFSFAAVCWLVSPLIFMLATVAVVVILVVREFHSDVLQVLREVPPLAPQDGLPEAAGQQQDDPQLPSRTGLR